MHQSHLEERRPVGLAPRICPPALRSARDVPEGRPGRRSGGVRGHARPSEFEGRASQEASEGPIDGGRSLWGMAQGEGHTSTRAETIQLRFTACSLSHTSSASATATVRVVDARTVASALAASGGRSELRDDSVPPSTFVGPEVP